MFYIIFNRNIAEIVFANYDISTPKRIVAFIANVMVQTNNITFMVEPTTDRNFSFPYGWNADCEHYNGGCMFKGRGILQLHGEQVYKDATIHARYDFIKNPSYMAVSPHSYDESAYFWLIHGLNELAEDGDWKSITQRLTIGYSNNQFKMRLQMRDWVSNCYRPITNLASKCGFTYICSTGDSIESITTRYRMLPTEIRAFNPQAFLESPMCFQDVPIFIPKC